MRYKITELRYRIYFFPTDDFLYLDCYNTIIHAIYHRIISIVLFFSKIEGIECRKTYSYIKNIIIIGTRHAFFPIRRPRPANRILTVYVFLLTTLTSIDMSSSFCWHLRDSGRSIGYPNA
jgi:hypothetical protein